MNLSRLEFDAVKAISNAKELDPWVERGGEGGAHYYSFAKQNTKFGIRK